MINALILSVVIFFCTFLAIQYVAPMAPNPLLNRLLVALFAILGICGVLRAFGIL